VAHTMFQALAADILYMLRSTAQAELHAFQWIVGGTATDCEPDCALEAAKGSKKSLELCPPMDSDVDARRYPIRQQVCVARLPLFL